MDHPAHRHQRAARGRAGFLSCLVMGAAMIESGRAHTVLAIGADLLTRYLDQDDPATAMLFGDGAGAVVLASAPGASRVAPAVLSSAASLPIALAVAQRDGRLRSGDRVLLAAFGAGLVWGGVVLTWGPLP